VAEVGPFGFAVVDKDLEWTSHDVVAKARGVLGTRKVGHSGTLDPGATGVLVLGVGRATKLLRFITALEVTATHDMANVTIEDVRAAAAAYVGPIQQIPPMVSAIKIDGKRLHQLAREGKTVERKPRSVTVHRLEVSELPDAPSHPSGGITAFRMEVECSAGTYIRTLGADIGTDLGGGASLQALRRTAIGTFGVDQAHKVEAAQVIPPLDALGDYDRIDVDDETAKVVLYGRPIDEGLADGDGPWLVVHDGELIAVHERIEGRIKPGVVFS